MHGVAWSPDGSQIAASVGTVEAAAGDTVEVYNAQSGAPQLSLPIHTPSDAYSGALAWSSDGKYIAASTENAVYGSGGGIGAKGGVSIWNVATRQQVFLQTSPQILWPITFQPGTDILALPS